MGKCFILFIIRVCSACLTQGWKNTWDEWLGEERVLSFDEDNLKKQSELIDSAQLNKNGKRIDPNAAQVLEKKKKRKDSVLAEKVLNIIFSIRKMNF